MIYITSNYSSIKSIDILIWESIFFLVPLPLETNLYFLFFYFTQGLNRISHRHTLTAPSYWRRELYKTPYTKCYTLMPHLHIKFTDEQIYSGNREEPNKHSLMIMNIVTGRWALMAQRLMGGNSQALMRLLLFGYISVHLLGVVVVSCCVLRMCDIELALT